MFKRSYASKDRAGKATRTSKRSFGDQAKKQLLVDSQLANGKGQPAQQQQQPLTGAIITIVVGQDQRLFAAHEDVLCRSPFFQQWCKQLFFQGNTKRLDLTDEEPETFSCVLEYLYKADYYPRLMHDRRGGVWYLEDTTAQVPYTSTKNPGDRGQGSKPTMYHSRVGADILRDTAVYCAAERFGLDELKRLALRKQGLQSGIEVATILRSARYAYDNTPDSDSRLRAHYLALIIRSRKTFKRSGTMQLEMDMGGKLWFDLFVAMCNHMDDIASVHNTPKTV